MSNILINALIALGFPTGWVLSGLAQGDLSSRDLVIVIIIWTVVFALLQAVDWAMGWRVGRDV